MATTCQKKQGAHCAPPPQVNFLNYLKNALSYRVETFWLSKKLMNLFSRTIFDFNLPPTRGYHSYIQRLRMFLNDIFQPFPCKISPELEIVLQFPYDHEGCPKWNMLLKFGLTFR